MHKYKIKNISKEYDNIKILNDISFDIEPNTITAIVGPNGCGKSTLLNIISGIDKNFLGDINLPKKNSMNYIFQNYRDTLLPWKNNYKNISFPLEIAKESKEEINNKIYGLQKLFGLDIDFKKYPYQLSGGQQQQLVFLRSLMNNPNFLLIDEPFSALDYETNLKLRNNLQKYYLKYKPTILMITHNIEEAVHLAKNIIVLSKKPTYVVNIITNNSKYPRNFDYLKSKEFHKIKTEVLNTFQEVI